VDFTSLCSSGKPLRYREVKISDDGEILVKGKTLFSGYLEDEIMVKPFDKDGWFHTGDLGDFDHRGNLQVVGRKDNLFISGGENIQPEEIESYIQNIKGVECAAVVPLRCSEYGNRPLALVSMHAGCELSLEQLRGELEDLLPHYKLPVAVRPFPKDAQRGLKLNNFIYEIIECSF
jgi:O-succinylbenzoic acid--CoA ligase